MTDFDQVKAVQEACYRVREALNRERKDAKGTVTVTVMDGSLLYALGKTKQMITAGTGNFYADIRVFDGNQWISYLIAGNSPKDAVAKAVKYALDKNSTDAALRERIDQFRIQIGNYLSQRVTVVKQSGIVPNYRIVFECDLESFD